jgi:hypothetical protein
MTASLANPTLQPMRTADTAPKALVLPSIEQSLAYAWAGAVAVVGGLLRPHTLDTPRAGRYQAEFTLTPSLRQRWHSFFRTDATREIPYLFHTATATLLAARLLADLGLNLRHVTPMHQMVQLVRDADPLGQVTQQRLDCRLHRVMQLASGVVSVQLLTTVSDLHGQVLAVQEDHYAVRHVDTALVPTLQRDRQAASQFAQLRRREAQIAASEANIGEWVIGADWGRQFSRLAGTLSLAHGARWLARLIGLPAPTLPAACLRNLLVRQLADVGLRPERLEITFCRPVYLRQRITIAQRDGDFEVTDARGVLLAFGRC